MPQPNRKGFRKKLPPLDFSQEVEEYEAHEERRDVTLKRCDHSRAKVVNGELRCPCGAGWSGPRLAELQEKLAK